MARNMNLPHVSIPNGPGEQPDEQPERRRPTAFGANMDTGRMTQHFSDGSQETRYNGTPAEQMFEQMGQVIQRGQAARQQKRQLDDAALASALVYSKQNNGFMPPDITNAISEQLGLPIAGGNFAENGDYIIYGRKQLRSANGKVSGEQIVPLAIANPEMQFRVLQRSGLGQSMQEELYDGMRAKMKLTDQQLADRGILDPRLAFAQNPANARASRGMMRGTDTMRGTDMLKMLDALNKYESDFPQNNNGQELDESQKAQLNELRNGIFGKLMGELGLQGNPQGGGETGIKQPVTELPEGLTVGDEREVTTKDGKRVTVVLKQKGDGSYVWASK